MLAQTSATAAAATRTIAPLVCVCSQRRTGARRLRSHAVRRPSLADAAADSITDRPPSRGPGDRLPWHRLVAVGSGSGRADRGVDRCAHRPRCGPRDKAAPVAMIVARAAIVAPSVRATRRCSPPNRSSATSHGLENCAELERPDGGATREVGSAQAGREPEVVLDPRAGRGLTSRPRPAPLRAGRRGETLVGMTTDLSAP